MIKGVNKKIVEINNPDSLYFEKAVLYVRPNVIEPTSKFLSSEAETYLKTILPPDKTIKRMNGALKYILYPLAAVFGAAILISVLFLIFGS